MANGYFERGEIYWVRMDSGFGYEQGVGRPGVILSCNTQNNSSGTVTVAYCSKQPHGVWEVAVEATGCTSYVKCNQIGTVDKMRLGKCIGVLNNAELRELENTLDDYFDLGYVDEEKEAEFERLKNEVSLLMAELESKHKLIIDKDQVIDNMKAKYNKAVDRIVELELDRDIAARKAEVVSAVEEKAVVEEEPESPVVEEQEKVEEPLIESPIEPKPKEEFVRQVVNVNTASAKDISEKLGVSMRVAYDITGYRNKNGAFVELEELLYVPKVSKPMFDRIKDYALIEEPQKVEEPEPEPEEEPDVEEISVEKVNINTASPRELMAVGFSKEVAARIIHHRKMCPPFKNIDELTEIDGLKTRDIRKLRDKLEV